MQELALAEMLAWQAGALAQNLQYGIEIVAGTHHAVAWAQERLPKVREEWNILKRTKRS